MSSGQLVGWLLVLACFRRSAFVCCLCLAMPGLLRALQLGNFDPEHVRTYVDEYEETCGEYGIDPILEAAIFGDVQSFCTLLRDDGVATKVRYGDDEISLLDVAVLMKHQDIVKILLETGFSRDLENADSNGNTALHKAVSNGQAYHSTVVGQLLLAGANIDAATSKGITLLHRAACHSEASDAVFLLRRGANKDAVDRHGRSPVYVAAQRGHLATMRALLAAGANATLRSGVHLNSAPLDAAVIHGHIDIVFELVRYGVDVNAANNGGYTALHHAARYGQVVIAKELIRVGASFTALADLVQTPLNAATRALKLDVMRVLLQHGAPVGGLQGKGLSPKPEPPLHSAARQAGKRAAAEAVYLLLSWGAGESELDFQNNTAAEMLLNTYHGQRPGVDPALILNLLANAPVVRARRCRALLRAWIDSLGKLPVSNGVKSSKRLRKGKEEGGGLLLRDDLCVTIEVYLPPVPPVQRVPLVQPVPTVRGLFGWRL